MGIGAYTAVLFSMTPTGQSILTNSDLYPFLVPLHLPFLPSLLIGGAGGGLRRRAGQLPAHAPLGCRRRDHHLCPAGHHPRGAAALGPGHQWPAHPVRCGQLHHSVDQRGLCRDHHLCRLPFQGVAHRPAPARHPR